MRRRSPPPSSPRWWPTALTLLAVALAYAVMTLVPDLPHITSDEVRGAIDHLTGDEAASAGAGPTESPPVQPMPGR